MNTIVEALARNAQKRPAKTAVIAQDQPISYADLWKEARGFCSYLKSIGIQPGDHVVHKASHTIAFAVCCFGIHLLGAVSIPVEKTIKREGLSNLIQLLSAKAVISDLEDLDCRCLQLSTEKIREYAQNTSVSDPVCFPAEDQVADMLFTTGTTGKSKGVMLSHRNLFAVAENVQYGANITEDNVYLIPVPINHAGGIRKLYVSILTGSTAVLLDGFMNVKKFFETMDDHHVTSILMPPSAIRLILMLAKDKIAEYSAQLDHIHTGSAAFPEADKVRLCELLPDTKLYFAYGSSESGCVSMYDYSKNKGLSSCVGKPNKNAHIVIVDENRKEIQSSREKTGRIAISGPMNMLGYYHEPALTANTMENGFVYTSDIGYFDENGFLYMIGRQDDVINVGGLKIAPTEVEAVALRYEGVADCVCYAVEDRMGGMLPKMNVVMDDGAAFNRVAFQEFLAKHLEAYKVPKQIEMVANIPHTANGKVDRKQFRPG